MFRLTILEGKRRGQHFDITSYPFVVGSNVEADLRMPDIGVWSNHAAIELESGGEPHLKRLGDGMVSVNAEPATFSKLRNGDLIAVGAVVFCFSSSPASLKNLGWLPVFVWFVVGAVVLLELFCVAFLLGLG